MIILTILFGLFGIIGFAGVVFSKKEDFQWLFSGFQLFVIAVLITICLTLGAELNRLNNDCPEYELIENVYKLKN